MCLCVCVELWYWSESFEKERVYSFDESMWKRRLKDDHFVDWKWSFAQESCCWGFFLFLFLQKRFSFFGRKKVWWLIVSVVMVFEGWIRSTDLRLWVWESWNCSISFWERLFSSSVISQSFFSFFVLPYFFIDYCCVFYQWGGKKTALSSVCEKGYFEIVKFLIEKGAKVDQTTMVSLSFFLSLFSLLIGSCFHFF